MPEYLLFMIGGGTLALLGSTLLMLEGFFLKKHSKSYQKVGVTTLPVPIEDEDETIAI